VLWSSPRGSSLDFKRTVQGGHHVNPWSIERAACGRIKFCRQRARARAENFKLWRLAVDDTMIMHQFAFNATMTMRITIALLLVALAGAKEEFLRRRGLNSVNQALSWTAIAAANAEEEQSTTATNAAAASPTSKPAKSTKAPKSSTKASKSNTKAPKSTKGPKSTKEPKSTKAPKNPPPHCPEKIDYEKMCDPNINAGDTCNLHTSCQHACLPSYCKLPQYAPHKVQGYGLPDDRYVKLGSVCGSMVYGRDLLARHEGFSPRHEVEVCCLVDDMTRMDDPYQDGECVGCYDCEAPQKVNDVCCKIALGSNVEEMGRNGDYGPKCRGKMPVCCKCALGDGSESYKCIGEDETCDFKSCEDTTSTVSTSTSTVMTTLPVITVTTTLPVTTRPATTSTSTATTTTMETITTTTTTRDYVTCPSGWHCDVDLTISDDPFSGNLDACVEYCHTNLGASTFWVELRNGECNCYDSCDFFDFDPLSSLALVDDTDGGNAACPTKSQCRQSISCAGVVPFASNTTLDTISSLEPCLTFCSTQNELPDNGFESYWVSVGRANLCECYSSCETAESTEIVNSLLILVDETADGSALCPPEQEVLIASGEAEECPSPHVNYVIVGDSNVFGMCIDSTNPTKFQQNNVNLLEQLANFEAEKCWGLGDKVLVDNRYSAFMDRFAYSTGIQSALVNSITDINPSTVGSFQLTSPGTLNPYKTVILDNPVDIPLEEQFQLIDFMLSGGRVIIIVDGQLSDKSVAGINDMIQSRWGGTSVFDATFTHTGGKASGSTVNNLKVNTTAGDLCYVNGRNIVLGGNGVPLAYYSKFLDVTPGPSLIVADSISPP